MRWEKVRLEEICEINIGKTPSRNNSAYWGGSNPWVAISDMRGDKFINSTKEGITDHAVRESGIKIIPKNTILYSFKLSIGKVAITNEPLYTNEAIASLPIKDNTKVSLEYLYWALQTLKLDGIGDNAVMGVTLNKAKLKELEIPLPPLTVQQNIADILDKAEALRRKDQELLKKYDELAQAIFIDMFGDPVKNEKGWEVKKLGDIGDLSSGSTPSRSIPTYFEGNIPWVKTTEVNGDYIYNTSEKITEEALRNSSCKIYPPNSVIIAMYGQGKTRGQCSLLMIEATTNQACCVISNLKSVSSLYLLNLLKLLYNDLRDLGRGGNQPNLNVGLLKNYMVIIPPLPLQEAFALKIELINQMKANTNAENSEELFQSLLQGVFKE